MKKINPPIKMDGYEIALLDASRKYDNGKMAVQTFCADGEPACTISVNIPEHIKVLGDGEFFLKGWSENEDAVAKLHERGIIEIVDKPAVKTGFVTAKIARLNLAKLEA